MTREHALAAEVQTLREQLAEALRQVRTSGQTDTAAQSTAPQLDRAQKELHGREQLFRAIFDGVNDGIVLVDSAGVYMDANPAACVLLGATQAEIIGRRSEDFAAPGYDASAERRQIVADGGGRGLFLVRRRDGTERELEYSATRDILPGLHLSVIRDVTEQKRVQKALEASEQKYRRIVDTAQEGIWLLDAQARTTFVNRALEEMLGWAPGEMLGMSLYEFIDDEGRALAEQSQELRRQGVAESKDQKYLHKNGTPVWVLLKASPLTDDDGNYAGALAMVTDVTERRRTEEAHRASEERYRLLFESSPLPIWLTDVETLRFIAVNQAALHLLGYSREEFLTLSVPDLLPSQSRSRINELLLGSDGQVDSGRRGPSRKDGTVVQVEVTSRAFVLDGRKLRLVIAKDLTERNKLEAELAQSRKMEAIGILAGGVAHDFNNLLSIIVTYTTFVLEELEPGNPIRADIEQVASAGERAVLLTKQLLAFSRQQLLEPKIMDLSATVAAISPVLRRVLGRAIEVSLLLEPALGRVNADPGQIDQVIMNLCANARDAMPNGGLLTIDTANLFVDDALSRTQPSLRPGHYVRLRVSDTGAGMDAATREHIFEPFFTTKEVGKGKGLGLSTVLGIVQQSGGHLDLRSEVGRGTTVEIYLPQVDGAVVAPSKGPRATAPLGGGETLLVVEDDPQVRDLTLSILRRNAYDVLGACDGHEAIRIAEQHALPIHLLLTDLVMPHMNGRELAERLLVARPNIRVLFMTGYTDDAAVRQGVLDSDIDLLQKPVTPQQLVRRVRDVLDDPQRERRK